VKMGLKQMLLGGALAAAVAVGAVIGRADAQVLTPPPDQLRYEAVLNEPIGTLDRRSVVAGTSALLVRARRSGQCYLAVTVGNSVGLAPAPCEP
jgi:hypothetical protein